VTLKYALLVKKLFCSEHDEQKTVGGDTRMSFYQSESTVIAAGVLIYFIYG